MVYFVGAGCGAADLITVRGMRLLQQADVIIYAGSLVNPELTDFAKKDCEIYNSAKMILSEVICVIQRAESEGKMTVRLHTGDASIYGAVREQMDELDRLGIPYESCPGVSACFGAAASLNLEYTLPGISQSLIITRMEGKTEVPEKESIESFAAHQASMAVYLSAGMLKELAQRLVKGGYGKDTPAVLVYKATWPEEEAYFCTLETLYDTAKTHNITKTALVLVGEVITHQNYRKSRLYAPDFSTEFRPKREYGDFHAENRHVREKGALPWTGTATLNTTILSVISFTEKGQHLSEKISGILEEGKTELYTKRSGYGKELCIPGRQEPGSLESYNGRRRVQAVKGSVSDWAKAQMEKKHVLLFIGACGIAVRAVAPHLRDKLHDSPVLVMDEEGQYIIPLLSGHVGGANELAAYLAENTGAKAVITTATDINGKFAADLFAAENGLFIENKEGIARVSSKVLRGEKILISIEEGIMEEEAFRQLPAEVERAPYPPDGFVDVLVTSKEGTFDAALLLRPREYVIGIGCKKGKSAEEIEAFLSEKMQELGITKEKVLALASISLKAKEQGILAWCRKERIPFLTYEAEELLQMEGTFSGSDFVREQTGVDNVCERAALKACGPFGKLVMKKQAGNGMTIAVAGKQIK